MADNHTSTNKDMSKMTRKISLNPRIGNQSTFDFNHDWIVVKEGDNIKEFKGERKVLVSWVLGKNDLR